DSKDEALQQLYQLHPDLNSQSVWFFSTLKKSAEVWIKALSSQCFFKGKKSALATIFLKPNCNEMNIGQIIKGKNYLPYFKNIQIVILLSIKDTLTTMIYDDVELIEPIKCTIFVNGLEVRNNFLEENSIRYKISTIDEIHLIVQFFKTSHACIGQCTKEKYVIMEQIQLPLFSSNENIRIENKTINCLQLERLQLIEWLLYKDIYRWMDNLQLTKSDKLILAHEEFAKIKLCLNVLSSEQLFEKHIEYGPDILIYINNNLVNNQPLKKQFNDLLHIAYEFYYNIECKNKELLSEFIYNSIQLSKEAEDYLLTMNIDLKNDTKKDAKPKTKLVTFKKEMLPENLDLALGQLKIWAQNNEAKSAFEKVFTLSDLKILI
ncbi:19553_t:CDS:2, partial [Gigaspora margarita]